MFCQRRWQHNNVCFQPWPSAAQIRLHSEEWAGSVPLAHGLLTFFSTAAAQFSQSKLVCVCFSLCGGKTTSPLELKALYWSCAGTWTGFWALTSTPVCSYSLSRLYNGATHQSVLPLTLKLRSCLQFPGLMCKRANASWICPKRSVLIWRCALWQVSECVQSCVEVSLCPHWDLHQWQCFQPKLHF